MGEKYDSSTRLQRKLASGQVESEYITLKEASAFTPYSQEYLSFLARGGKIEAKKFGRNWRVQKAVVEKYYTEHKEDLEKFGNPSRRSSTYRTQLFFNNPKFIVLSIVLSLTLLISGYAITNSPVSDASDAIAARSLRSVADAKDSIVHASDGLVYSLVELDKGIGDFYEDLAKNIEDSSLKFLSDASDVIAVSLLELSRTSSNIDNFLYTSSIESGRGVRGLYTSISNTIYNSSLSFAQSAKYSWTKVDDSLGKSLASFSASNKRLLAQKYQILRNKT